MKSQRAYVEHVLECIRTLQNAILRNLQILCESTRRLDIASFDRLEAEVSVGADAQCEPDRTF